jgi:hypothetical protein
MVEATADLVTPAARSTAAWKLDQRERDLWAPTLASLGDGRA